MRSLDLINDRIDEMLAQKDAEIARLREALERIALLDEADGHELKQRHAFEAVAIATSTLGKHPSEICADRRRAELTPHKREGAA